MEHRDTFLIEVIVEYCDQILQSVKGIDKQKFMTNLDMRDACALRILQIGENANGLSQNFLEKHSQIDWRAIRGLRNIIAHEYGNIDKEVLWEIISEDIPRLREECLNIIRL